MELSTRWRQGRSKKTDDLIFVGANLKPVTPAPLLTARKSAGYAVTLRVGFERGINVYLMAIDGTRRRNA
jgi:hypothetical protein